MMKLKKKKKEKLPTNLMERITGRYNWYWQDSEIPLKHLKFNSNWIDE